MSVSSWDTDPEERLDHDKCQKCGRKLTVLFTSSRCDECEPPGQAPIKHLSDWEVIQKWVLDTFLMVVSISEYSPYETVEYRREFAPLVIHLPDAQSKYMTPVVCLENSPEGWGIVQGSTWRIGKQVIGAMKRSTNYGKNVYSARGGNGCLFFFKV